MKQHNFFTPWYEQLTKAQKKQWITRLTKKQKFILKNGRKTYCSNCYEPATATSENEGYSNCCGKHIITAGETLEAVNRDLANLSK